MIAEAEDLAQGLDDAIRSSEGSMSLAEIDTQSSLVQFLRTQADPPRRQVADSRPRGAHTTTLRRSA
jgi:hypothetical protein